MMQKKWKKTMVGLLSVCLVATFVPQISGVKETIHTKEMVQAATAKNTVSGKCGKKATWKYNAKTKTLTISGSGAMEDYEDPFSDNDNALQSPWGRRIIESDDVQKVVVGDKITKIGTYCFANFINLKEVKIGKKVKTIEKGAFNECEILEKIKLGSSVKTIGSKAFAECKALKTVELGKNVETIGSKAFSKCVALETINLGDKVKKIGTNAFLECGKLTGLYIGKSVKSIGDCAFNGCNGLKQLNIHAKNKYFVKKDNVLLNKKNTKIYLGCFGDNAICSIDSCVTDLDLAVLGNTKIEEFNVSIENKKYSSEDGVLYSKDGTQLLLCPRGKKGTVVVSEKAVRMDYDSETAVFKVRPFENCANMEKLIVGTNIKYMDSGFVGCINLKEIEVEVGNEYYASATGSILSRDKNKLIYFIMAQEDGMYTIPEEVTKIESGAFSEGVKAPQHIVIPATVTAIETDAFYNVNEKAVFHVPAGTKDFYTSLLTAKTGFKEGMTIKEVEE